MMRHLVQAMAALASLPPGFSEAELLQALARIACTDLGCRAARVRDPASGEVLGRWPEAGELTAPRAFPLPGGLVLEVEHGGPGDEVEVLALAGGRLLEEARTRTRLQQGAEWLARQVEEVQERHRSLTLRLAELRSELDTTQQRHLVLRERNRIAQDLHDRAAQTNFLLALKLDWVLEHLAPDDPMRPELERLKELAARGAAETREAIYALRASELVEEGLQGGLRRLVRSMEADGFTASLTVTGIPVPLPPEVEDGLFKVAQEALNNARKHSQGSAVIVALRYAPASVTLVVQDDGIGFSEPAPEEVPGRLGLRGMRERVAALGGEIEFMCGDEGGLIVRATIPLKGDASRGHSDRHRG